MWLHLVPGILSFFCSGGGAVVLTLIMDRVSPCDCFAGGAGGAGGGGAGGAGGGDDGGGGGGDDGDDGGGGGTCMPCMRVLMCACLM